jgi:cytochrome b6-f complex iron-sulfur subunit
MSQSQENAGAGETSGESKKSMSPIEKIRAAAAAKAAASDAGDAGATGAEAKPEPASAGGEPAKAMSPLEKIRAAAAAKAAAGGAGAAGAAGAEVKPEKVAIASESSKPMSPLEKIRAQQAAKKVEGGAPAEPTKVESPIAKPADVKEKPAKSPPPKPAKHKTSDVSTGSRRFFLFTWVGAAWAAFIAGCSQALLGAVRFLYPNVLQEPPTLFKVGSPDKFEEGNVYEQWKNEYGVWIVRQNGQLYSIRTVCTHLGCTPNWLEGEQKFKCPCHGSGFRKTGINFEGPAPRPLERYVIHLADDGQVEIDKSRKLQQELGQWTKENGAFIEV